MTRRPIALVLMAKAPVAGACKTRLAPPLTPAEAASLARAFVADVAAAIGEAAAEGGSRGILCYTPATAAAAFAGLLPAGFGMRAQQGADLGERLDRAVAGLLAEGWSGVCLINGDSPTLPAAILAQAVDALARPGERLVLAPAIDGGYCLIGMKRRQPSLFRGMPWSTEQVLAETLRRIAALTLPVTLLPPWYDIDDAAALRLLIAELFGGAAPVAAGGLRGSAARHTRACLASLLAAGDAGRFA